MVDLFNLYQKPASFLIALIVVSLWTLVWKGLGLWHSGKNQQKGWFVVMLILNTAGLLPIIYLIWFKPKEDSTISKIIENKSVKKKSKK